MADCGLNGLQIMKELFARCQTPAWKLKPLCAWIQAHSRNAWKQLGTRLPRKIIFLEWACFCYFQDVAKTGSFEKCTNAPATEKFFSSKEPVFVTLHPQSSKNRLIRETQGSSLERARGKFFSATLRGPLSIAGAVKNSWAWCNCCFEVFDA